MFLLRVYTLKYASLYIEITGGENGSSEELLALDGYSFSLAVQEENNESILHEVYNSGTISANGQTKVIIDKPLKDYIDITNVTYVKASVTAINVAGGRTVKDTSTGGVGQENLYQDILDDKTPPVCVKIQGEAATNSWISASTRNNTSRSITVECDDQNGSGCIRENFTRTWPDDYQADAEYAYVQIEDNAGNKNVDDIYLSDPCSQTFSNDKCRVLVNVDKTYPQISVQAFKRKADGSSEGGNVIKSGAVTTSGGGKTAETKTLSYDKYNNSHNNWLNLANYPNGIIYQITLTDTIHLDSWTWVTNKTGVEKRDDAKFTQNRTDTNSEVKSGNATNVDMTQYNCGSRQEVITVALIDEGMRRGVFTVKDKAGNTTTMIIEAYIDHTKPTCEVSVTGTNGDHDWFKEKNATLSMTKSDKGGSKVNRYGLTSSATTTYNSLTSGSQGNTEATGIVWHGYVEDTAGNANTCVSRNFKVDKNAPACTISLDGTKGSNNWYKKENVNLTLDPTDTGKSGVDSYKLTTSTTPSYSTGNSAKTGTQSADTSSVTWHGYVKDGAGNVGSCRKTFKLDKTKPTCEVGSYSHQCTTDGVSATVSCSDALSGVSRCAGSNKSSKPKNTSTNKTGIKGNDSYTVVDAAGNENTCSAVVYSQQQTRYRRRDYTCIRCANAGCQSSHRTCTCPPYWNDDNANIGGCWRRVNKRNRNHCEVDCGNACMIDEVLNRYYCIETTDATCTNVCDLYYQSCGSCGDTVGSWGSWSSWSNGGCTQEYTPAKSYHVKKECGSRTLYRHKTNDC